MKYIKKLIRNSKRALNQLVSKNKQEIVKYAPRLTGIQAKGSAGSLLFWAAFTALFFCTLVVLRFSSFF